MPAQEVQRECFLKYLNKCQTILAPWLIGQSVRTSKMEIPSSKPGGVNFAFSTSSRLPRFADFHLHTHRGSRHPVIHLHRCALTRFCSFFGDPPVQRVDNFVQLIASFVISVWSCMNEELVVFQK